jgi:hypothetical protein
MCSDTVPSLGTHKEVNLGLLPADVFFYIYIYIYIIFLQDLEKKEKNRLKQRQLGIRKQKAEMEEILLEDKDEDGDASSTNESEEEEEVVEVGRETVKEVKKPPSKLAPIFMLGKPPKVQQTNNYLQFFKQLFIAHVLTLIYASNAHYQVKY